MSALSVLLQPELAVSIMQISIILFFLGFFLMASFTNLYTVVLTVYPAQVRSTGLGWSIGLGRAGAVLSPMLAGLMISWGVSPQALFLYFLMPVLAAAVCIKLIPMIELE